MAELGERTRALGFVAAVRSPEADDLQESDPRAFLLLTYIARHASRTENRIKRLKTGEARVGNPKRMGLTPRQYRSAKDRLEEYGLATFNPTNKGTLAMLCGSAIYDINPEPNDKQTDKQATNKRQAGDKQTTSNNKEKKKKKEKKGCDALLVFDGLILEERYGALTDARWRGMYELWVGYRTEFKMPLTEGAVKRDLDNMLRVLAAGGSFELIYQWIQDAEYTGGRWRGWFFQDKFEEWKQKRKETSGGRGRAPEYKGEESE